MNCEVLLCDYNAEDFIINCHLRKSQSATLIVLYFLNVNVAKSFVQQFNILVYNLINFFISIVDMNHKKNYKTHNNLFYL